MSTPLAIATTGFATSVGLSARASCAAIRAGITNPTETRFASTSRQWIMAHQVPLSEPWRGRARLVQFAALAIEECLPNRTATEWEQIPLLLCISERSRPGRIEGLEDRLLEDVQRALRVRFSRDSTIIPQGRTSVATALAHARALLDAGVAPDVMIAATDSFVTARTLSEYQKLDRLLSPGSPDGFIAGEGGAALLVTRHVGEPSLGLIGIGLAREPAPIGSGEPLRADGLTAAIRGALEDAAVEMHQIDFRVTDISGEQYYFKEAALALSRTLRVVKEEFDIWHPAECIGEAGAMSGVAVIAAARAACQKGYTKGPNVLTHWANDAGQRAALTLRYRAAT